MYLSSPSLESDGVAHHVSTDVVVGRDQEERQREWDRDRGGKGECCQQEDEWLHDFALYAQLKQQFGGQPWYEWPEPYKLRHPEALQARATEHCEALDKIKWLGAHI